MAQWLTDPHRPRTTASRSRVVRPRLPVAGTTRAAQVTGRTVAVVEPEVVRAAGGTGAGGARVGVLAVDVPPLTATELSGRAGRWNVRVGWRLGAPHEE